MATKKAEQEVAASVEKTLVQKLVEVSEEIGFIEFDARNQAQSYGYASAAGIIRAINKAMASRGLLCVVTKQTLHHFSTPVKKESQGQAVVEVEMAVTDGNGDVLKFVGIGQGADSYDKAVTKALTAAKKYALAGLLTLGWGAQDPEADESTDRFAKEDNLYEAVLKAALEDIKTAKSESDLTKIRAVLTKMPEGMDKDVARAAYVARQRELGL